MRDDYKARSPDWGQSPSPGEIRGRPRDHPGRVSDSADDYQNRHHEREGEDIHRSRQDRRGHSRSPSRRDFDHDNRGGGARREDGMSYGRARSGRYEDEDDYGRRRHYISREHDYGGMYDDAPPQDDAEQYGDRYERGSRGGYSRDRRHHDRGDRSRSRGRFASSRSQSPTRDAGKPSDTVILEGLPFSLSATELRENLLRDSVASEFGPIDVRISSSKGYRRAFVQFESIEQAAVFVKENFPKLPIQLENSTDDLPDGRFDAYIHYARSRDDIDTRITNSANWICSSCDFSNYSTRSKCKMCGNSPSGSNWQQSLTGSTDAADMPSQILVVYPLPQFVNEDMFANDIRRLEIHKPEPSKDTGAGPPKLKSTAPTVENSAYGARPGSLHRVFLMRETETDESLKYGFAEFWTLEDATAAMTKFKMLRAFHVAACAVTVSNIHMGVFLPETRAMSPAIERMSFHPLFNPTLLVRYRDLHAYPSQKIVNPQAPALEGSAKQAEDEPSDGKKSKKRKAEGSLAASTLKKSVPMAGQMAMWQKKHDELRGQKPGQEASGSAESSGPYTSASASQNKPSNSGLIKISLSGTKTLDTPTSVSNDADPGRSSAATEVAEEKEVKENAEELYMDRARLMCLICMRKYKSLEEVGIHEKSRNHRNSMENEELVKAALPRLAARDKRMQQQAGAQDGALTESQYRDRAKERREAFNQPKKPSGQPTKPKPEAKRPQDDKVTSKPAPSKGAGMLAKMGWTAGTGLGANADGRVDVVASNAYQEGVGLGAEGGNLGDAAQLAEKKTKNSYTEYVNSVQDRARERYNKMT